MLKIILLSLSILLGYSHNPVYNVIEADPMKDPNRPLVP
jgi:hypothetical protein